jgi:hypothetical protein
MKKLPLLLIGYAILSRPSLGQEKKPMPPPAALCTAGVAASECKEISEYLGGIQQATLATSSIQFVIADAATYKTEKDRALAVNNNSPGLQQLFLFSVMDSFYKLNDKGGGRLLEKVYLNESTSCHAPVIEPAGKISDTKFGDYDPFQCVAALDHCLGFIEGVFLGANNAINWMQCAIDNSCRKQ